MRLLPKLVLRHSQSYPGIKEKNRPGHIGTDPALSLWGEFACMDRSEISSIYRTFHANLFLHTRRCPLPELFRVRSKRRNAQFFSEIAYLCPPKLDGYIIHQRAVKYHWFFSDAATMPEAGKTRQRTESRPPLSLPRQTVHCKAFAEPFPENKICRTAPV